MTTAGTRSPAKSITERRTERVSAAATILIVAVWDPFVRVFHWTLAAAFAVAWVSAEELGTIHEWSGYLIAALVATRVLWGFAGTTHARFSDFVHGPRQTLSHLKDTLGLRARRYLGHNPAAGAMVVAMLVMLTTTVVTGIMMISDAWWGSEWLEEFHEGAANATLLLVGLHLVGVLVTSFEHGENLVRAMVTGKKRAL